MVPIDPASSCRVGVVVKRVRVGTVICDGFRPYRPSRSVSSASVGSTPDSMARSLRGRIPVPLDTAVRRRRRVKRAVRRLRPIASRAPFAWARLERALPGPSTSTSVSRSSSGTRRTRPPSRGRGASARALPIPSGRRWRGRVRCAWPAPAARGGARVAVGPGGLGAVRWLRPEAAGRRPRESP